MAGEKEKKETELSRNRFHNTGQRRTLHAIDTQVERERQKVIVKNTHTHTDEYALDL